MPHLRLALAQINPVVGDLDGNAAQVLRWARRAAEQGADIIAFPEMALTGYPVEDLALRRSFQDASRAALTDVASKLARDGLGDRLVVLGYLDGAPDTSTTLGIPVGAPQNAAAFVHGGQVVGRYAKHHLPNYGVFDEFRYFVPGTSLTVAQVRGVDVAVVICEDIWQDGGPVATVRDAGAGLLIVINGSPYERHKDDVRLELVRRRAADTGAALAYVNMVGGQDELVFDGDSIVVSAQGEVLARAPQFEEHLLVVDLDLPAASTQLHDHTDARGATVERLVLGGEPPSSYPASSVPEPSAGIAARLEDDAEVYGALVTGVRDYVRKNGFQTVVIAVSGGIDSALTAAIACDALGAANVHGVSMPSGYSSEHSKSDAVDLAERTGLQFQTVPIAAMVDAFLSAIELTGLAEENLQARVRGVVLMGLSNQHGHLVLATGNKSELSVGYSTLYGDAVGKSERS